MWSFRLQHSYLRREEYQVGIREDWRYNDMKKADPKNWWWKSCIMCYIIQQPMILGLSLPIWAVNFGSDWTPFGSWTDILGAIFGFSGVIGAFFADKQLYNFMKMNSVRQKKLKILYTGLWKYSQHPNYFFENLYWFGLALMAISCGEAWVISGAAFNFFVMLASMDLIDKRMVSRPERKQAYQEYMKVTSYFVPLPPKGELNPEYWKSEKAD